VSSCLLGRGNAEPEEGRMQASYERYYRCCFENLGGRDSPVPLLNAFRSLPVLGEACENQLQVVELQQEMHASQAGSRFNI
jgi:hypothetical protein